MVSGVPLDTPIQNRKCDANDEWITQAKRKNNSAPIQRVCWIYSNKQLEIRRQAKKQSRGSLIVSLSTEEAQAKLVKHGLYIGAEWFPVCLWDVSLTDNQCFRCWKWGHSQSVCNAAMQHCGHCAGTHPTSECTTTDMTDSSCACCKTKGHKAWMAKGCKGYQAYRQRNKLMKSELMAKTINIQASREGERSPSPRFNFVGTTYTGGEESLDGKKRKIALSSGRPRGIDVAARQRGQTKLAMASQPLASPSDGNTGG